jgi:uncharacterized protein (DUF58 family)
MKKLYLEKRFFYIFTGIIILFILGFILPSFFLIAKLILLALIVFFLIDILIIFFKRNGVKATRILPEKLSNGDNNPIDIFVKNYYPFKIKTEIIDEIPFQFQKRDFSIFESLLPKAEKTIRYTLRPTERGEYNFGRLLIYVKSPLQLIAKRFEFNNKQMLPTYPSFIQLRRFDLIAMAYRNMYGIKKVRRIGHTMEFEQIKEYVLGDDIRTINWKATAKRNQLMVNQFQDEKAQPIYSIIDKGRVMKMPFNGLSLLDYAINSTLVISNITLKKGDKAGIATFSKKIENRVVAERRSSQMNLILEALYNIKTDFKESDFGVLYADIKRNIKHRSLLFLYTNFETLDGLDRQLAYLQSIAKNHVLVVVFFENTELEELINKKVNDIKDIYHQTIAEKFIYEKKLIVKELKRRGVYSILTKPENLTVDVINKYLEFKSRGVI